MKTELRSLTTLALLAALVACGGTGTNVAGIDRGGINGGGSVGVVTGFGSVFVNGTRYDTDAASITVDGQPAIQADLDLGFVVAVQADIDAGGATASSVNFDSNVIGPVSGLDAGAGTLTVLGQAVRVTTGTYFADSLAADGLAGLVNGDIIRLSGLVDADDEITATRIDPLPGSPTPELQGTARDVDTIARRLRIGDQIVDYSAAGVVSGFPGGEPVTGDQVRVKGQQAAPGNDLQADELIYKGPPLSIDEDDEVEIEGFITDFVSASDFKVAGFPVTTDGNTEYEDGSTANLALNVRVEVEGIILAGGQLLAEEIEFEQDGDVQVEATVDSVDSGAGTLTLLGILMQAQGLTDLDEINAGECAKVRGAESTQIPGQVIATRLEDEDSCPTTLLRGFVEAVADPEFTILGVTVQTNGATSFPGGSAAAFFAAAPGRLVEAKGTQVGNALLAEELEFKDD